MLAIFTSFRTKSEPAEVKSLSESKDGRDPDKAANGITNVVILTQQPSATTSDATDTTEVAQNTVSRISNDGTVLPVMMAVSNGATNANSSPKETTLRTTRPNATNLSRFSFKALGFIYTRNDALSAEQDNALKDKAKQAAKKASLTPLTRSERRAKQTAVALQQVIVGPAVPLQAVASSNSTKTKQVSKAEVEKIRSQLLQPKSANKVIAQLRQLPVATAPKSKQSGDGESGEWPKAGGAIHAVCLPQTEAELEANHFGKLATGEGESNSDAFSPNVSTASIQGITSFFSELKIVDFINDPLGIGNDGNGPGILSGALPTAGAIADGFVKITPELMGLGYATGKAVQPNHSGVYPPLDRMSVITYWWGLEITMPKPTMVYLDNAKSITHSIVNVLTALSVLDAGVREILPFVRYISQFVDFEWSSIKRQDKGQGVVCAATWIMPAALVPRPWDFPDPPIVPPRIIVSDGDEVHTSTSGNLASQDEKGKHANGAIEDKPSSATPAPSPSVSGPIAVPSDQTSEDPVAAAPISASPNPVTEAPSIGDTVPLPDSQVVTVPKPV